jgi:PAS domain S-box-containing protein
VADYSLKDIMRLVWGSWNTSVLWSRCRPPNYFWSLCANAAKPCSRIRMNPASPRHRHRNKKESCREVHLCTQKQARSCVCKGLRTHASLNRDFKMEIPAHSVCGFRRFRIEFGTSALAAMSAVTAAYFLTGKLGLYFATVSPSATVLWAPSGLSLAACLWFGLGIWPAIFAGAFLVNLTIYGSILTSLAIAVGNTAEALTGAYLVSRFARGVYAFNRTRDTFRFVLFATVLSTMLSATIGVTSLCAGGYAPRSDYPWIWLTWWTGDATGELIFTPLLILWTRGPGLRPFRQTTFEAGLFAVTFVLVAAAVFGGVASTPGAPAFFFIPVLLWAAFRFGPRGTATVVFLISVAATAATLDGVGPFSHGRSQNDALLLMQIFVALIGTSHLIVAIEVAERRKLDELRWRLAAIVESSTDAIIAISPEGQITAWNAGAERMYGFPAAESIGQPIGIIVPPDRMGESAEVLARINSGETIAPFETVRLRKDGATIDVFLTVSPVKDGDGHIIGASKSAHDISQLTQARQEREALLRSERAARKEAEAANRAKDEFLAMLGHELRNPLQAISMAARLLQSLDSLEKARGVITRQSEHLSRLVDDLLDAARVTSGKIVLSRRPLDLAELVSECIVTACETGQIDRHAVETDLETVWVDGDAARLSQIVMNLLSNAGKYTPKGGQILVRVKGGDEAVITVSDNGAGISPDILPRVFDLFARGEFGFQRSPAGLGIGLTLVRRIAELHGGRAEAVSEGPGRGSTFTVRLPRIAAPQTQFHEREGETNELIGTRRILLIEDNDDSRESLRALLEASGHVIYEAADGCDGVERAVELRPDAIIIDLGLPGLDGYEVAARIRSTPGCRSAILIALTGYGQSEYRTRAEMAGFNAYLVKPVDSRAVEKLIAVHSAQHA